MPNNRNRMDNIPAAVPATATLSLTSESAGSLYILKQSDETLFKKWRNMMHYIYYTMIQHEFVYYPVR